MRNCVTCPIRRTEYCHRVNPKEKKYTLSEKEQIRKCLLTKTEHTHNHIFNVVNKNYFSKIYGRKIPKNHKTNFMATFMYLLNDIGSVVSSFSRAHIFGKGKKKNTISKKAI